MFYLRSWALEFCRYLVTTSHGSQRNWPLVSSPLLDAGKELVPLAPYSYSIVNTYITDLSLLCLQINRHQACAVHITDMISTKLFASKPCSIKMHPWVLFKTFSWCTMCTLHSLYCI